MAVTLDPATEQSIQRKIEHGHFREPAEVITRALDLLDAESELAEQARAALDERLKRSMDQIARGQGIPRRSAHGSLG